MSNSKTNGNGTSNGNSTPQTLLPSFSADTFGSTSAEPLSQSDRDTILQLITQINTLLPFLRDLSAEERKSMLGMGNKNRIFAGKVSEVIQQKSDFLPRSFDIDQFNQDLATFDRLSTILMALNQLRDLVDSTAIAIGSEAYENALTAYRHAKASGQGASLEAMMAEMSQRFARKPKQKTDEKPETKE
ncbi:hypothetical protein ACQ4M3_23395 [Leptolyngbya sp. AN03gr2]|uniref:hypothetical protein n=1 Tax=unclassified Leptolyngbya TaxID=2650499 RepID=UPI003D3202C5